MLLTFFKFVLGTAGDIFSHTRTWYKSSGRTVQHYEKVLHSTGRLPVVSQKVQLGLMVLLNLDILKRVPHPFPSPYNLLIAWITPVYCIPTCGVPTYILRMAKID